MIHDPEIGDIPSRVCDLCGLDKPLFLFSVQELKRVKAVYCQKCKGIGIKKQPNRNVLLAVDPRFDSIDWWHKVKRSGPIIR